MATPKIPTWSDKARRSAHGTAPKFKSAKKKVENKAYDFTSRKAEFPNAKKSKSEVGRPPIEDLPGGRDAVAQMRASLPMSATVLGASGGTGAGILAANKKHPVEKKFKRAYKITEMPKKDKINTARWPHLPKKGMAIGGATGVTAGGLAGYSTQKEYNQEESKMQKKNVSKKLEKVPKDDHKDFMRGRTGFPSKQNQKAYTHRVQRNSSLSSKKPYGKENQKIYATRIGGGAAAGAAAGGALGRAATRTKSGTTLGASLGGAWGGSIGHDAAIGTTDSRARRRAATESVKSGDLRRVGPGEKAGFFTGKIKQKRTKKVEKSLGVSAFGVEH